MRERAFIHIAGPKGVGKTTLVERILGHFSELILAARCVGDDSARQARQATPKAHPDLRRYRAAGAADAAVFTFGDNDVGADAFFETPLMEDYSEAVLLEGDNPLGFVDLAVFVAPPPLAGRSMLVRRRRDRAKEERQKADAMEDLLRRPDGVAEFFGQLLGVSMVEAARRNPKLLEDLGPDMLSGIAQFRKAPPPRSTEHWAIADPEGPDGIRRHPRLAREQGTITAAVADLADPEDAGTKKALARVRRAIRRPS